MGDPAGAKSDDRWKKIRLLCDFSSMTEIPSSAAPSTRCSSGRCGVIRTPYRAPRANAFAERWVLTVRTECLDWILIRGRRHLERVLREYVDHYVGHGLIGDSISRHPSHEATRQSSGAVR